MWDAAQNQTVWRRFLSTNSPVPFPRLPLLRSGDISSQQSGWAGALLRVRHIIQLVCGVKCPPSLCTCGNAPKTICFALLLDQQRHLGEFHPQELLKGTIKAVYGQQQDRHWTWCHKKYKVYYQWQLVSLKYNHSEPWKKWSDYLTQLSQGLLEGKFSQWQWLMTSTGRVWKFDIFI